MDKIHDFRVPGIHLAPAQQIYFRWPDSNSVSINRINISGPFPISSKSYKISVVHDES